MEWFMKVVKNHYADFNGRARRKEFWMYTLVYYVILIALTILMILGAIIHPVVSAIIYVIMLLVGLALTVPTTALAVRRMHDVGKEWWYMLLPFYNIVLSVTEGEKGDNEYGPDPKAEEH